MNIQIIELSILLTKLQGPLCIFVKVGSKKVIVTELRGGSWVGALGSAAFFGLIFIIITISGGTHGFIPPPANPGWGLPNNLYDPPALVQPADCSSTQLYAGSPTQSLKTWVDRNKPNSKDRWILLESRPELVVRRGQSQYKTKDHGALAGLSYKIKSDGGTSTLRTEANINSFMDVIEEIVENPNSIWFEAGMYQRDTTREIESINIYNEEQNRVIIFTRETGEFITFCQPDKFEVDDLMKTGNFGGQDGWFSGHSKNLPPNQSTQNVVDNEITPVSTFESDVMGITPAALSSPISEVPNQGVTPLHSFESDVLGFTPMDSSTSDPQI